MYSQLGVWKKVVGEKRSRAQARVRFRTRDPSTLVMARESGCFALIW